MNNFLKSLLSEKMLADFKENFYPSKTFFSSFALEQIPIIPKIPDIYDYKKILRLNPNGKSFYSKFDKNEKKEKFIIINNSVIDFVLSEEATVLILNINYDIPEIAQICMDIENALGLPPNSCDSHYHFSTSKGGFHNQHLDDHSFFSIQISGKKQWKINSKEFNQKEVEDFNVFRIKNPEEDFFSSEALTFNMEPGCVLFTPRNCLHKTLSLSKDTSIHLSFGLKPPYLLDVLLFYLQKNLEKKSNWNIPLEGSQNDEIVLKDLIDELSKINKDPVRIISFFKPENPASQLFFQREYTLSLMEKLKIAHQKGFAIM